MIRRSIAAILMMVVGVSTRAGADDGPSAVVRQLNTHLVGVLKDADTLGYAGRVDRLGPAVDAAYDLPFMAEKSLGQHWKSLGADDQQRWIGLSRQFSIANYAANFDHWANQSIDLLGEEPSANDTVVVRTRINDPKGEPVEMNYRLRQTASGWKVVDVFLKGTVSELALRRSDYTATIEKDGFPGLVRAMEQKLADLAAGKKPN